MAPLKRTVTVLLFSMIVAFSAFSFDISSFPSPIQKGTGWTNLSYDLGNMAGGSSSMGATFGFDYALPINFGLTLGGEFGAQFPKDFSMLTVPLSLRMAWHPNFEVQGLDPYILAKIGAAFDVLNFEFGVNWGFMAGLRYFLSPTFGFFVEGGLESIAFIGGSTDNESDDYYGGYYDPHESDSNSLVLSAEKYFSVGMTFYPKGRSSPARERAPKPAPVPARRSVEDGVYLGIVSFGKYAEDITDGPIYLDETGYTRLTSALDNRYKKDSAQGTSLYYAVHKGLANITANASKYPDTLNSVILLTFTDGLDNNSGARDHEAIEGKNFRLHAQDYLSYVQEQVQTRTVLGKKITAYSAGVRGSDITDESELVKFRSDLRGLASTANNFYELTNFAELNDKFKDIASKLTVIDRDMTFALVTPDLEPGTKVRMTFDTPGNDRSSGVALRSTRYLEGEITERSGETVLTNITYNGVSANTRPEVRGTLESDGVNYIFPNFVGFINDFAVKQWTQRPGSTSWQIASEYELGSSVTEEITKNSVVIYMVLDKSTSMTDEDLARIRVAAKSFIENLLIELRKAR